ncbi:MAG: sensor histidine kinase [Oscillospiraceae bacterium]|nr:sensor histidine kinase [Oscillospiraceae bacterium]
MKTERKLSNIAAVMFALNLSILSFYSLICVTTTFRICDTLGAHDFLALVRQVPRYPWQMPVQSLSMYALLWGVSYFKVYRPIEYFPMRVVLCATEILLCAGIIWSLDFYYSGVALLVLADLVHYIRNNKLRLCFIIVLSLMFAFGRYEIVAQFTQNVAFSAYLSYYNPVTQSFFTILESLMACLNILLFVLYMILLFTGQKEENERIRKLNEQLNQANDQLRDYAVNMERMAQMRERNRLAREIHDTLGHTLTGIIMGADAGLALLDVAPEESRKRIQVVAQTARDGLTDVRRSIKALRPDALERSSLGQALEGLVENFRLTTAARIDYCQEAGELNLDADEEDVLYRVVQEGMTNAVRHGKADRIAIRVTREGDVVTVSIRDNGTGCDKPVEGFGLRHMRERLQMLGGTLTYGNREQGAQDGYTGFFIRVKLPVRNRKGDPL